MTTDLYGEFGLTFSSTTQEIKMAYKRKALLLHPDKNIGKTQDEIQKNTETFQRLTSYYEILIDPAKRERYDRTGSIQPETLLKDQDVTWSEYFDCLFQKVTEESIIEFEKQYKYSSKERDDIFQAYHETKGSLLDMIDRVPLSSLDDINRFRNVIQEAIDKGELEIFKKFPTVNQRELQKRKARAKKEAQLVEKELLKAQKENESTASLEKQLQERNASRLSDLISRLEQNHQPKEKKRRLKKEPQLPSEEEFLALQEERFGKKP